MRFIITVWFIAIINLSAFAQISGNHVYSQRYNQNNREVRHGISKPVIIKDSIMLVSVEVLMNAKADSLVVTLGLSQEAKTTKDANTIINKRLAAFKSAMKLIGIRESDTYVDFITQTKIYDYNTSGHTASQVIKGFEIKKNIIIKMPSTAVFDKLIEAASESEIYDIVKVDYIAINTQKSYFEMMVLAETVIKKKKEMYTVLSPLEFLPVAKIIEEIFYGVYPTEVMNDYPEAKFIKKIERKAKTFYYDKLDQSTFDLVINDTSPVVGIQYVLKIQMQFDIRRK